MENFNTCSGRIHWLILLRWLCGRLVAVLFPNLFPDSFRDHMSGIVGLYFEAASVIVTFGRALSEATIQNIRQNLFFAFIYNALGVPVAAGILYPFTGMLLSPMIAAAAMSISSVSVILNALRLKRQKLSGEN